MPKILEMARSVAGGHQPNCRFSHLHRHSSYIKGIEVIVSNIFVVFFFLVFLALDPKICISCSVLKGYGPKNIARFEIEKKNTVGCKIFLFDF